MNALSTLKVINQIAKPIRPVVGRAYNSIARNPLLRKYSPISMVTIETTNICNLRCPGCYRTSHDYPSKNKNMSFEDFKMYIDQLPPAITLVMHGLGEPTVNPDLPKMVKYAHDTKKFSDIHFVTNALARKPSIYEGLFADGLSNMRISVDSLNQEEVEKMRPGTNVELLKENLKYLLARFSDKISIIMVCSKVSVNTFEKTIEEVAKLGAKIFRLQPYEDFGESTKCLSNAEKDGFLKSIDNLRKKGINIISGANFEPKKAPCYSLYFSPVITVDGYLTPCNRIMNKEIFNFGNLKETSFKDLYFSKRIDDMQEGMTQGKYPGFCDGCYNKHTCFN